VVTAVLKFGFRLFVKEALNKRRPVEEGNAVTETGVLSGFIGLLPDIRR
jgi:hypothetical protein